MSESNKHEDLICWNCYEKTPPPKCVHCGAEIQEIGKDALAQGAGGTTQEEFENRVKTLNLSFPATQTTRRITINVGFVREVIEKFFPVEAMIITTEIGFRVPLDGEVLGSFNARFNALQEELSKISPTIVPAARRDPFVKEKIVIFLKQIPANTTPRWFHMITAFFLTIAGMIAGYSWLFLTQDGSTKITSEAIWDNLGAMLIIAVLHLFGYLFGLWLVFKLGNTKKSLGEKSFIVLPSIPHYPVGIFAFLVEYRSPPKNREQAMKDALYLFIAWFIIGVLYFLLGILLSSILPKGLTKPIANQESTLFPTQVRIVQRTLASTLGVEGVNPIELAGLIFLLFAIFQALPVGTMLGGNIARALFGRYEYLALVLATITMLLYIDYVFGIILALMHLLTKTMIPLDTISAPSRKWITIGSLVLLVSMGFLATQLFLI